MPASRLADHSRELDRGLLFCGCEPVHLPAKSFALLACMAALAGRVLAKDALLDAVWPDVTVTEASPTRGDPRPAPGAGRGGRPDRALARLQSRPRGGPRPGAGERRAGRKRHAAADRAAAGRDGLGRPRLRLTADGRIGEPTRGLGRFGELSVVARHSAFRLRPETEPHDRAARRPGARLEIDARRRIEASGAMTGNPDASVPFAAGVGLLRDRGGGVTLRARALLGRAIARDPGFARARAYLGLAELIAGGDDRAPRGVIATALEHVGRAPALAPQDPRCHWVAAIGRQFGLDRAAAGRHAEAIARYGCLTTLSAFQETKVAACLATRGDFEVARALLDRAAAPEPGWDPVAEAETWLEPERAQDRRTFVDLVRMDVERTGWPRRTQDR